MTVGTSPEPSDSTTGSRHNRWRFALLIGTGVTATVLFATISRIADFPILDTLWLASPDQVELLLEDLSTTQRGAYRVMLRIDYLYAGAYTAFLVTAIALSATPRASGTGVPSAATSRLRSRITRVGLTAAILTGTLDVIENSLALALLSGFSAASSLPGAIGPVTSAKWLAASASAGVLLIQVLFRISDPFRRTIRS
jgi:hypothetical protein